jgi:hypothetical protein
MLFDPPAQLSAPALAQLGFDVEQLPSRSRRSSRLDRPIRRVTHRHWRRSRTRRSLSRPACRSSRRATPTSGPRPTRYCSRSAPAALLRGAGCAAGAAADRTRSARPSSAKRKCRYCAGCSAARTRPYPARLRRSCLHAAGAGGRSSLAARTRPHPLGRPAGNGTAHAG